MTDKPLKDKKILIVVAYNDYQDLELKGTKKVLRSAGAKLETASSSLGTARGKFGGETRVSVLINEVDVTGYQAAIFIGGPGTVEYVNSNDAHRVIKEAAQAGVVLGAICMAPQVLAKAGVLSGKKATVWASATDRSGVEILQAGGAEFVDQPVVTDGKVITADGPEAAADFGEALVRILQV
ncbi:DJ-1/PfpI family protein [Patescibacteria group bacterium]|nr:DJ-1/PfpI family protein [Patescibacteria group bacterium]